MNTKEITLIPDAKLIAQHLSGISKGGKAYDFTAFAIVVKDPDTGREYNVPVKCPDPWQNLYLLGLARGYANADKHKKALEDDAVLDPPSFGRGICDLS